MTAFAEDERERVAKLAIELLSEETIPETISLVAIIEDAIVGHIAFSPATASKGENLHGYILAPLAVSPDYQKLGIGSKLVEHGIQLISAAGATVLLVYGDPKYYGRFGFSNETAVRYLAPYKLQYPFGWQALLLNDACYIAETVEIGCVASLCDPALW